MEEKYNNLAQFIPNTPRLHFSDQFMSGEKRRMIREKNNQFRDQRLGDKKQQEQQSLWVYVCPLQANYLSCCTVH